MRERARPLEAKGQELAFRGQHQTEPAPSPPAFHLLHRAWEFAPARLRKPKSSPRGALFGAGWRDSNLRLKQWEDSAGSAYQAPHRSMASGGIPSASVISRICGGTCAEIQLFPAGASGDVRSVIRYCNPPPSCRSSLIVYPADGPLPHAPKAWSARVIRRKASPLAAPNASTTAS